MGLVGIFPFETSPLPGTLTPFEAAPDEKFIGGAPDDFARMLPFVGVFVETEPQSGEFALADRIDWRGMTLGLDGDDVTCRIFAGLDAADLTATTEPIDSFLLGVRHLTHAQ